MALDREASEELLGWDEDEVFGLNEELLPGLVEVRSELPEARRSYSAEAMVLGNGDVYESDLIDARRAELMVLGGEKLLAHSLVIGLIHVVFDLASELEV